MAREKLIGPPCPSTTATLTTLEPRAKDELLEPIDSWIVMQEGREEKPAKASLREGGVLGCVFGPKLEL